MNIKLLTEENERTENNNRERTTELTFRTRPRTLSCTKRQNYKSQKKGKTELQTIRTLKHVIEIRGGNSKEGKEGKAGAKERACQASACASKAPLSRPKRAGKRMEISISIII